MKPPPENPGRFIHTILRFSGYQCGITFMAKSLQFHERRQYHESGNQIKFDEAGLAARPYFGNERRCKMSLVVRACVMPHFVVACGFVVAVPPDSGLAPA